MIFGDFFFHIVGNNEKKMIIIIIMKKKIYGQKKSFLGYCPVIMWKKNKILLQDGCFGLK